MESKNYFRVIVESANIQPHQSVQHSSKMVYESEFSDESLENIIDGFISCMRGNGWLESTIIEGMRSAVESYESLHGKEDSYE